MCSNNSEGGPNSDSSHHIRTPNDLLYSRVGDGMPFWDGTGRGVFPYPGSSLSYLGLGSDERYLGKYVHTLDNKQIPT